MFTQLQRIERAIEVPPAHADLLGELQAELGLARTVARAEKPSSGTSRLRAIVVPDSGVAHIRVEHLGADVLTRVAHELDGLDAFDLGAVHLDVPLAEPGAGAAVTDLERLGFCYAAWLPDFAPSGDVLRLQRVGSHPVEVEHIICARSQGERIRDYVIADWHRVRRGGVT
jgi:hypothetical protein